MEYIYNEFPEEYERIKELKKKDVQRMFDWYVSQSETRIDILKQYVNQDSQVPIDFDYTPESLIPLWTWFEPKIRKQRRKYRDILRERKEQPKWMREYIPREEFTLKTLNLIWDIAYYFAEVMLRNNKTIKWGFFLASPRVDSAKEPVLMGFVGGSLNPQRIVCVCTLKSYECSNPRVLYETYKVWLEYIEEGKEGC